MCLKRLAWKRQHGLAQMVQCRQPAAPPEKKAAAEQNRGHMPFKSSDVG
jgi:hypothetical protein